MKSNVKLVFKEENTMKKFSILFFNYLSQHKYWLKNCDYHSIKNNLYIHTHNYSYIDNEGRCNIKFSNKMSIDAIKLFLDSLNPYEDKSLEDFDVQYYEDYEFTDDNESIIYTPNSFNYNSED